MLTLCCYKYTKFNHTSKFLKAISLGYTTVPFGKNCFSLDLGEQTKIFSQYDFDACYAKAITGEIEGVPVKVLFLADLIREKKATARPKDLGDLVELEKIQQELFPED